jgi:hypothetical protein
LTGTTLGTHPYEIGRFMLVLFNVIPLIVYFLLLAALVERFGTTDWGLLFVMAAATFGTFLTTFAVTINNHVLAAVCVVAALYAAVRIVFDGQRRLRYFIVAGLFAALAVTNDLPAASFAALLAAILLWRAPRGTLLGFLPAAAIVAAAFFATNWVAHGTLELAYLHRSGSDNWYDFTYERNGRQIESYWRNPVGVDRGEPSRAVYALHALVGHHGIFSLTPIWILSAVGLLLWIWKARGDCPDFCGDHARLGARPQKWDCPLSARRWLAAGILAISVICIAFYLGQPQMSRSYGGMTSGLRWMFWLTPLWLLAMLPTADAMAQRRSTRGLALILLALSVLSVSYPTWNPWTPPWIMKFLQYLGWVA